MFASSKINHKYNQIYEPSEVNYADFNIDAFFNVIRDGFKLIFEYLTKKDFDFDLSELVEYYFFDNNQWKIISAEISKYRDEKKLIISSDNDTLEYVLKDVYKFNMQMYKNDKYDSCYQIKNLYFYFIAGIFAIKAFFPDKYKDLILKKIEQKKIIYYIQKIDNLMFKINDPINEIVYLLYTLNNWVVTSTEEILNTKINIELRAHYNLEKKPPSIIETIKENLESIDQKKELVIGIDDNVAINRELQNDAFKHFELTYEKLKDFKKHFHEKIIGQEAVIDKINEILISEMYHVSKKNHRPIGVLFFVGPTGVGKTETVKELAKFLYNSDRIHRFDMSEYKSEVAIQKLIGAPNGYVGYQEGGTLTNAMQRNSNTIVLFDEIEKADKSVFDLFLQMIDEGVVTSNKGIKSYFDNTIIVFTSNLGVSNITAKMGYENIKNIIKENVEYFFNHTINRPELLGRIGSDNIIVFNLIDKKDDLFKILDIQFKDFIDEYSEIKLTFDYNRDQVYEAILKDVDLSKGARDIRNKFETFKKHLYTAFFENALSIKEMNSKKISFSYDGTKVKINAITKNNEGSKTKSTNSTKNKKNKTKEMKKSIK